MTARLSIAILLLGASAWSQSVDTDWQLVQAIPEGQSIRVHTEGRKHDGQLASASPSAININLRKGGQVSVPRNEVTHVYTRSESHRGRNTLIGTAIGVGLGIASYATFGQMLRNEGVDNTGMQIVVSAAIGAGIGAALPSRGFKKIFEAKKAR